MAYQEACKKYLQRLQCKNKILEAVLIFLFFPVENNFYNTWCAISAYRLYCSLKSSTFLRVQIVLNYFVSLSCWLEFNHICSISLMQTQYFPSQILKGHSAIFFKCLIKQHGHCVMWRLGTACCPLRSGMQGLPGP